MTNTNTAAASGAAKHYAVRDHEAQGVHYINHVSAMTGEGLHAKSAIAAELAHRDMEIDRLRAALAAPTQPAAQAQDACNWSLTYDDSGVWESSCGEEWIFIDGGPAENSVRFCHGCGKPVAIEDQQGGSDAS